VYAFERLKIRHFQGAFCDFWQAKQTCASWTLLITTTQTESQRLSDTKTVVLCSRMVHLTPAYGVTTLCIRPVSHLFVRPRRTVVGNVEILIKYMKYISQVVFTDGSVTSKWFVRVTSPPSKLKSDVWLQHSGKLNVTRLHIMPEWWAPERDAAVPMVGFSWLRVSCTLETSSRLLDIPKINGGTE
jgi:hypothetical protein